MENSKENIIEKINQFTNIRDLLIYKLTLKQNGLLTLQIELEIDNVIELIAITNTLGE